MIIVLVKRLKQKPNKLVVLRLRYVDLIIYHHIFSGFLLPQKQRPLKSFKNVEIFREKKILYLTPRLRGIFSRCTDVTRRLSLCTDLEHV